MVMTVIYKCEGTLIPPTYICDAKNLYYIYMLPQFKNNFKEQTGFGQ